MERVLEPELMEDEAQALAYARADFVAPNLAFCAHLERLFPELPSELRLVDLGCGPADIPRQLLLRHPGWRAEAVDGAAAMLAQAELSGLGGRLRLHLARLPDWRPPEGPVELVLSNSLLHHLPDPGLLWQALRAVGLSGAAVLVADLSRPASESQARELVSRYSAGEPEVLRRDFLASLCAAFRPDELRPSLESHGLGSLQLEQISDRHLLIWGRLP
jgi:SAM-dependent methyltransferase